MRTLIFGSLAVVGMLLVAAQHQQLGQLRAENASLQQASAEADQLKADLAKSTGNESQETEEIDRLRAQNHDLLKLRNEINQLRDARVQFDKVSAENQRLQTAVQNAANAKGEASSRPITMQMNALYNRGLSTPEDAAQTFFWAQRERNEEELSRAVTPRSLNRLRDYTEHLRGHDNALAIDIVARREVDAITVQLGLQIYNSSNPQSPLKTVITLVLQGGNWRVDAAGY